MKLKIEYFPATKMAKLICCFAIFSASNVAFSNNVTDVVAKEVDLIFSEKIDGLDKERLEIGRELAYLRCLPVEKYITKYSCRPNNSSYRAVFDTPVGFDCVQVNKENPAWDDYDFCQLQRANRENSLQGVNQRIQELLRKKEGALLKMEGLNEAERSVFLNDLRLKFKSK